MLSAVFSPTKTRSKKKPAAAPAQEVAPKGRTKAQKKRARQVDKKKSSKPAAKVAKTSETEEAEGVDVDMGVESEKEGEERSEEDQSGFEESSEEGSGTVRNLRASGAFGLDSPKSGRSAEEIKEHYDDQFRVHAKRAGSRDKIPAETLQFLRDSFNREMQELEGEEDDNLSPPEDFFVPKQKKTVKPHSGPVPSVVRGSVSGFAFPGRFGSSPADSFSPLLREASTARTPFTEDDEEEEEEMEQLPSQSRAAKFAFDMLALKAKQETASVTHAGLKAHAATVHTVLELALDPIKSVADRLGAVTAFVRGITLTITAVDALASEKKESPLLKALEAGRLRAEEAAKKAGSSYEGFPHIDFRKRLDVLIKAEDKTRSDAAKTKRGTGGGAARPRNDRRGIAGQSYGAATEEQKGQGGFELKCKHCGKDNHKSSRCYIQFPELSKNRGKRAISDEYES